MGMIENISILLIVYTDIFMPGYGYILGHSDHSAFTAEVLLAVFAWLLLGPILSPILGPVHGSAHVLLCCEKLLVPCPCGTLAI